MDKIKDIYKEAWKEHGNSPKAVCWPKGRQDLRFEKLISNFPVSTGTLLDYGCGLAHFKDFALSRKLNFSYSGVEMVEEFLSDCKSRFPEAVFMSPSEFEKQSGAYDFVICSGTFNIRYAEESAENDRIFKQLISQLFARTNKCLSLNLMTDQVDFQQPGAWHVNPSKFLDFVSENLSRRYTLDSSYMPYEYTVSIFKDDVIKRPENVFSV